MSYLQSQFRTCNPNFVLVKPQQEIWKTISEGRPLLLRRRSRALRSWAPVKARVTGRRLSAPCAEPETDRRA
ncbi:unnamed protein product, partial [Polarella glacialis]